MERCVVRHNKSQEDVNAERQEGMDAIPFTGLTPSHFCACLFTISSCESKTVICQLVFFKLEKIKVKVKIHRFCCINHNEIKR